MTRLIALLLSASVALSACAGAAQPGTALPAHYQLIIKFRTAIDDPAQPDFVQQLSVDAGATLQFERTLGTGAQLYSLDGKLDRAEFSAVLQRLSRRHDVLYAEEDRLVQPAIRK
jgi:hypothetical protein